MTERQLEVDEKFVPTVYKDSKGYATVAIGICIDDRVKGAGLTLEEGRWLTQRRVAALEERLSSVISFWFALAPARQGALLNMAYQMGIPGLLQFQHLLDAMRDERWPQASTHIMDSKYAREDSPKRARKYARQIETGEWQ